MRGDGQSRRPEIAGGFSLRFASPRAARRRCRSLSGHTHIVFAVHVDLAGSTPGTIPG